MKQKRRQLRHRHLWFSLWQYETQVPAETVSTLSKISHR